MSIKCNKDITTERIARGRFPKSDKVHLAKMAWSSSENAKPKNPQKKLQNLPRKEQGKEKDLVKREEMKLKRI